MNRQNGMLSPGAVYYYQRFPSGDGGRYEFVQKIVPEDGKTLAQFSGNHDHMATNPTGDLVAIGTSGKMTGRNEKVYLFAIFDNRWREVGRVDAPEGTSRFGESVALTDDAIAIVAWENTYYYRLDCADRPS